ncbi:MAG TPA: hypothetical protein VFB38_18940 [Chthonomonadaceae bacterium]|jgi:hypothetical protein|nr:hypothetical protein [Chthonomonadaceae bacterium]
MSQNQPQKPREDYPGQWRDEERDPGHRWQYRNPMGAGLVVLAVLAGLIVLLYLVATYLPR